MPSGLADGFRLDPLGILSAFLSALAVAERTGGSKREGKERREGGEGKKTIDRREGEAAHPQKLSKFVAWQYIAAAAETAVISLCPTVVRSINLRRTTTACKIKVKVNADLYITPRCEHTSKALRYGTRSQGISQSYLYTPLSSANGMSHISAPS